MENKRVITVCCTKCNHTFHVGLDDSLHIVSLAVGEDSEGHHMRVYAATNDGQVYSTELEFKDDWKYGWQPWRELPAFPKDLDVKLRKDEELTGK